MPYAFMARPIKIDIVKHLPMEDLNKAAAEYEKELRSYSRSKRMHERLCFIRMRYKGYTVEEAASANGMTTKTGYNIQELWNEGGMAALEPRFGGGRRSKMTDEQKAELEHILSECSMSTKGVKEYIYEEFGIEYTNKQVYVILHKMGLNFAKPYPKDHRRPADAEAVLKKE
jgi:putative transposase